MSEATKETVNHPEHYNKHPSGVECITIVEHFNFNIGNAIKYLWRAGFKSPDPKEDLNKSVWYVQRELERLGGDSGSVGKKARELKFDLATSLTKNVLLADDLIENQQERLGELDMIADELKKVQDELNRERAAPKPGTVVLMALERLQTENTRLLKDNRRLAMANAALEGNHTDKVDLLRRISDLVADQGGGFLEDRVSSLVKDVARTKNALDAQDKLFSDLCALAGVTSGPAALRRKIEELKTQAAKVEALEPSVG